MPPAAGCPRRVSHFGLDDLDKDVRGGFEMSVRYLTDTEVLAWLLAPDDDRVQGAQRQAWLSEMSRTRAHLLVPATVLGDWLFATGAAGEAAFRSLRARRAVEVVPFDERCVRELVQALADSVAGGDARLTAASREARQLVALARARHATLLAGDPHLAACAQAAGVPCRRLRDLAAGRDLAQLALPLEDADQAPPEPAPRGAHEMLGEDVFRDISAAFDSFQSVLDAAAAPEPAPSSASSA